MQLVSDRTSTLLNLNRSRIRYLASQTQQFRLNPQNIPSDSEYSNLPPDINKESDIYLEVIIANDRNSRNNAAQLAEKLTSPITGEDKIQRFILAIIGSYTSEITCAALPIYSQANMPMISPTSSVENLKGMCGDPNEVFHRTITSSKLESEKLIEGLKRLGNLQKTKITAFYKKGKPYEFSQDLFDRFKKNLEDNGGKIDYEYGN